MQQVLSTPAQSKQLISEVYVFADFNEAQRGVIDFVKLLCGPASFLRVVVSGPATPFNADGSPTGRGLLISHASSVGFRPFAEDVVAGTPVVFVDENISAIVYQPDAFPVMVRVTASRVLGLPEVKETQLAPVKS